MCCLTIRLNASAVFTAAPLISELEQCNLQWKWPLGPGLEDRIVRVDLELQETGGALVQRAVLPRFPYPGQEASMVPWKALVIALSTQAKA